MADPDQAEPALADVLRALGDELQRGEADGVHVDTATLELDLVAAATADGGVDLRVAKARGGSKRGRATRLTVTVRPGPRTAADGAPGRRPDAQAAPEEPASPGAGAGAGAVSEPAHVRPPGLIDLLADALKSLADTASTAPASTWPLRPLPRDDRGEGMGPRRGA